MHEFEFTWKKIEAQYAKALKLGYEFWTCEQYCLNKHELPEKLIVNRVDIDFSVKKAEHLGAIYRKLGIKASFFIRLHAPEYNPFSFENYKIVKGLVSDGHELGYHSEIVEQAAIWNESAELCLKRDINTINTMFNTRISGVASHGGMTGLNNLDFWAGKNAADYGLTYEAYDTNAFDLFDHSFYVSDSEWMRWKCYDKGSLRDGDHSTFGEHLDNGHSLIYLLIHSDTYFDTHFYE